MYWNPDPGRVQLLALKHTAPVLAAAAACRSAAQLAHAHPRAIPDAAITEAVGHYAAMLQAALGSLGERHQDEC